MSRGTKILCTLGPASSSLRAIRSMAEAGMDAVRLNFSHGDHASHGRLIELVRKVARGRDHPIPIVLDLQGPRFRVAKMAHGPLELKRGMEVTLTSGSGVAGDIHVRPALSLRSIRPGQLISMGDLGVSLRVKAVGRKRLRCRVERGGPLTEGEGVSFPKARSTLPSLTAKDIRDLEFGKSMGVTFIALSFVRSASDVKELRRRIGGDAIGVISKIETREAVANIDDIIDASDAILVARGDLASEVSISRLPVVQKILIEKCNRKAKPVITATQMLESMIRRPQPTRAEASDVANAVLDGSDTLMLSGETAIGDYPVEATGMMASIIKRTERAHLGSDIRRKPPLDPEPEVDETIAYLAARAAGNLGAKAIITVTTSGSTALRVAKFRPSVPIFAATPLKHTRLKLAISHGIICGELRHVRGTDAMIEAAIQAAGSKGIVRKGDLVVVTAGVPPLTEGRTNLLKIETA